jgi:hypothetical protein
MLDFFSLPIELRLEIYRFLIPSDRTIAFTPSHVPRGDDYRTPPAYNAKVEDDKSFFFNSNPTPVKLFISTNLFLVNRQIYREASDILYHENIFRFTITHAPARMYGCCIRVGPYEPNLGRKFPMLQPSAASRIKRMDLCVSGDLQDRRVVIHRRKWLTTVASNLTEAGNQLERLKVTLTNSNRKALGFVPNRMFVPMVYPVTKAPIEEGRYVLEPLVKVQGVKNVVIEGEFRDCFPIKLARVMESRDISLPEVKYEDKIVWRRRYGQKKKFKRALPGRAWFEPIYDWNVVQEAVKEDGA